MKLNHLHASPSDIQAQVKPAKCATATSGCGCRDGPPDRLRSQRRRRARLEHLLCGSAAAEADVAGLRGWTSPLQNLLLRIRPSPLPAAALRLRAYAARHLGEQLGDRHRRQRKTLDPAFSAKELDESPSQTGVSMEIIHKVRFVCAVPELVADVAANFSTDAGCEDAARARLGLDWRSLGPKSTCPPLADMPHGVGGGARLGRARVLV